MTQPRPLIQQIAKPAEKTPEMGKRLVNLNAMSHMELVGLAESSIARNIQLQETVNRLVAQNEKLAAIAGEAMAQKSRYEPQLRDAVQLLAEIRAAKTPQERKKARDILGQFFAHYYPVPESPKAEG